VDSRRRRTRADPCLAARAGACRLSRTSRPLPGQAPSQDRLSQRVSIRQAPASAVWRRIAESARADSICASLMMPPRSAGSARWRGGPGCGSVERRLAWWLARGSRWDLSREHRGVRGHERISAGGGGRAARRCLAGLRLAGCGGGFRWWWRSRSGCSCRTPAKTRHGAPCHARTLSIAPPGQLLLGCRGTAGQLPGASTVCLSKFCINQAVRGQFLGNPSGYGTRPFNQGVGDRILLGT